MTNEIPYFKYHLDPIKTGHAEKMEFVCACCQKPSHYAYTGAQVSIQDSEEALCFLCIKSGDAAKKFDLKFTWFHTDSDKIDPAEIEELENRTPGYIGWQEEVWLTHCNKIAQFQGNFTVEELLSLFDELKGDMKEALGGMTDEDLLEIIQSPDIIRVDNPAFYIFQCLSCSKILVHVDYT